MKHIRYLLIFACCGLLLEGCGNAKADAVVEVSEPVIMGTAVFGDYALLLRLCDGQYESVYSQGPDFGPNWTGEYELAVEELGTGTIISRHALTEWGEPLCFQENVELHLTDLNSDGCMEVLLGQYAGSNYNIYKMYYVDADMDVGYYSQVGDLLISSQEMSPALEASGGKVTYSYYDNAAGGMIVREFDMGLLDL